MGRKCPGLVTVKVPMICSSCLCQPMVRWKCLFHGVHEMENRYTAKASGQNLVSIHPAPDISLAKTFILRWKASFVSFSIPGATGILAVVATLRGIVPPMTSIL